MKRYTTTMALGLAGILLLAGNAFALNYSNNITIYDGSSTATTGWYGQQEDQETEPGMVATQAWDLEAFYQKGNSLTMVGGYNFKTGKDGFYSGDIFIDIDGLYGKTQAPDGFTPSTGNKTVTGNFGYEYVLDLDFSNLTYLVYKLDTADVKTITVYYPQNELTDPSSNPWRYASGGTLIGNGTIDYAAGLADAAVGGLLGGSHYAAGVDLSFLDPSLQFIAHFTMGCGNDNLLGKGTTAPVPEPATMLLFGSGITGLAAWQRRKFRKK
ncbi:MAG: PEP-CTERM sorting domain-containing protein [Thermodesulfobacteriota bacterium]